MKIKYTMPGYMPITDIGYKYNYQKVPSFVNTVDAWNTKSGISYLYKYPGHFYDVVI